jgi:hypothetical protein
MEPSPSTLTGPNTAIPTAPTVRPAPLPVNGTVTDPIPGQDPSGTAARDNTGRNPIHPKPESDMATITTRPHHPLTLITGLLALALALLAAGVLWLVVSASAGSSTERAPDDRSTAEPCEVLDRAANPNGPGALVSEQAVHWVTDEDRSVVNPNGPGAAASEHSVDGSC